MATVAAGTSPDYRPPQGHLGNLQPWQEDALAALRQQLQKEHRFVPERMDDASLLRFLRARRFSVPEAHTMLLDAEQWRKEFGVEDIVRNFNFTEKTDVERYLPQYYHKTDKDGCPVYVQHLGRLDVDQLGRITTLDRQLRALVREYETFLAERLPACASVAGHPVETSCTIMDLAGAGIGTFWKVQDYVREGTRIGQGYYPGCAGRVYIVNTPWWLSTVWSIIKPWLDQDSVARTQLVSSGDVKEVLLRQIPAENLPAQLGGTCQCVGGCASSDAGPWRK